MNTEDKLTKMDFATSNMIDALKEVEDEDVQEIIKDLEDLNYKINQKYSGIALRKYKKVTV